jgi:hypothetical protein
MKKNKIAIILTARKRNSVLNQTINAIYKQTVLPNQLIIVLATKEKINFSTKIKTKVVYSKIKNQVYQRGLGLQFLNKNINVILQLDDKIILEKNSIKYLLSEWNKADKNVAGIGINPTNFIRPKSNLFHKLTLTNSNIDGIVLPSGFVSGWNKTKKNKRMSWLNGGMTSWKLKLVPHIYNRKFPIIKWSVCEDLFFSYKVAKKYKLILCSKSKAKIIPKKVKKTIFESFYNGFVHARVLHSFVSQNKAFSIFLFYYAILSSSIIGIILNLILLNFTDVFKFIGRLLGSLFIYNKNQIN